MYGWLDLSAFETAYPLAALTLSLISDAVALEERRRTALELHLVTLITLFSWASALLFRRLLVRPRRTDG